jgi:hypothetical protein
MNCIFCKKKENLVKNIKDKTCVKCTEFNFIIMCKECLVMYFNEDVFFPCIRCKSPINRNRKIPEKDFFILQDPKYMDKPCSICNYFESSYRSINNFCNDCYKDRHNCYICDKCNINSRDYKFCMICCEIYKYNA